MVRISTVTGCTDCTICLWTLMGEKMGTFGEERDWKLTPTMHNFTKVADKAVFGKSGSQDMADEGASSKNVSFIQNSLVYLYLVEGRPNSTSALRQPTKKSHRRPSERRRKGSLAAKRPGRYRSAKRFHRRTQSQVWVKHPTSLVR